MDISEQAITGLATLSISDSSHPSHTPGTADGSIAATGGPPLPELGGLSPLQFFAEEVENEEDDYRRLHAYRRIKLVAQALGPAQTELALLPYLQEKASTLKDDEVLLILAQELGDDAFASPSSSPASSTSPLLHSSTALFPVLTTLAGTEETVVRDAAVESLLKVLTHLPGPVRDAASIFTTLAQGDMFCQKVSAAALFPVVYEKTESEEGKQELRTLLASSLATDDFPMVRRGVALALPGLIKVISLDLLSEYVVPIWKKLSGDDQDIVRIAAIEATAAVAQGLQTTGIDDQNQQDVVPIVRAAVEDRSWRVRQTLAKDYADISLCVKGEGGQRALEVLHHELMPGLVTLLQDYEAEVRIAACTYAFAPYCDLVGPSLFTQHLLPCATALSPDTIPGVRLALSTAILDLAPKLGKEVFMSYCMPLLETFLMDPSTPDVKVRLCILSRLAVIGAWLPSLQESFLPILLALRQDENWRIRKAVIEALPVLAEHMPPADLHTTFEDKLLPHLFSAFEDKVCEVRMAATVALHHLARVTGAEYIEGKVVEVMGGLYRENRSYLIRVAVLQALKSLAVEEHTSPSLLQKVLDIVLDATKDKIPNVRFTAAQVLACLAVVVDTQTHTQTILPTLQSLIKNDTDADVRFYSQLALEKGER